MGSSHEILNDNDPEKELRDNLWQLIDDLLPDSRELFEGYETENILEGVYGSLLAEGYDPDEIVAEYGIFEGDSSDTE
jgi:hypothetical protein